MTMAPRPRDSRHAHAHRPADQSACFQTLFRLDPDLLAHPAAQQARQVGVLRAKTEALHSAQRLVRVGRPLLFGTLAVSGVHLVHQFSLIKPASVGMLPIPDLVFHASTILTVLAIDAVAAFLVAVTSTSASFLMEN